MPQKATLTGISGLSESDETAWNSFRTADPGLASPYFSLDYLKLLDAVHPGIQVLRIAQGDALAGFLPFRRDMFGAARPPDGPLGDLHGLVAAPDSIIDLSAALKATSLGGYAYSGVPYTQARHNLALMHGAGNQTVDISQGYEAYIRERSDVSSSFRRMHRKVTDFLEQPGLSIVHQHFDETVFQRLIELKEAGYAEAGHFNIFKLGWPQTLLRELARRETGGVQGIFSIMRKDGDLVAACFCMRSSSVLHYWFPSYEPAFADQKPGHAMLFSLIEWAAENGIREVHLGPGNDQYKRQMATFAMPLRQGALAAGRPQRLLSQFHEWSTAREAAGNRLGTYAAKLSRKLERIALTGRLHA